MPRYSNSTPPSHKMNVLTPFPGIFLRVRAAGGTRAHPSSDGIEGGEPLHPHIPFVQTAALDFGELLLPAYPFCGNVMLTLFFRYFRRPRTAGGVRGVPRRDKRRWRFPSPYTSRLRRTTGGIARYVLLLYTNPPRLPVQENADPRFSGVFREPPTAGGMRALPR